MPRVIEVLGIELVHTRSVEGRAEIQIVSTRAFADETNLCEIRPRASVRAACHADDDIVRRKGHVPPSCSSRAVSKSGR